ncbi:hypothetical protein HYY71_05675 [Candidatus Woesearchaeota archaeon]|nr:hypothetical protein [Candidatus Woesearchaeota archaeon]
MSQNRPDLIKRFIGVASNIIAHKVLIKAELEEDLRKYYAKEIERDIDIALKYRNRINPASRLLPQQDSKEIRESILLKVKAELLKRVDKGYKVDLSKIDGEIDNFLKEQNVG